MKTYRRETEHCEIQRQRNELHIVQSGNFSLTISNGPPHHYHRHDIMITVKYNYRSQISTNEKSFVICAENKKKKNNQNDLN